MKPIFTIIGICILSFNAIIAQEDGYKVAPFQIGVVPPLTTNGIYAGQTVNNFSLNLFTGVAAGLDGFEAGGFLNIEKDFVKGAQFSGFGNIVGNDVDAFQAAGFMNIVGGPFKGFQGAGFMNLNTQYTEAAQLAGFMNTSGDFKGFQGAGFGNYSGNIHGVQAAGFMNVSHEAKVAQLAGFGNFSTNLDGAQVAGFMNTSTKVDGAQIAGFLNIADNVKGIQLSGFINICDSIDGIPIGIINIVRKNGYRKFEIWGNETHFLNLSFRMGVRQLYTIFTGSMRPLLSGHRWAYGLGIGTSFALYPATSMEIEGLGYHLLEGNFRDYDGFNSMYKLRLNVVYNFIGSLSIVAGPSYNVLVAENIDNGIHHLRSAWSFNLYNSMARRIDSWAGFHAGIRF